MCTGQTLHDRIIARQAVDLVESDARVTLSDGTGT